MATHPGGAEPRSRFYGRLVLGAGLDARSLNDKIHSYQGVTYLIVRCKTFETSSFITSVVSVRAARERLGKSRIYYWRGDSGGELR